MRGMKFALRMLTFVATLVALPVGIGAATVDCNQPVVPTNAIAIAQGVAQTATTVVADAQAVWPVIFLAIPAADQAAAQTAFNAALVDANHGILGLNDAIAAAIAVNTPNPNFVAVYSQLADAVGQVVAIVQQFMGNAPAAVARVRTAKGTDAVADMNAALVRLKAAAGK